MKPRITILIQRFYPVVGGMERQCQAVAERLVATGWDVRVLTRRWDNSAETSINGIPVTRLGTHRNPHLDLLTGHVAMFVKLLRDRRHSDIIHVYGAGHLFTICALASWLLRKPLVVRPATHNTITRYVHGHLPANATWMGKLFHSALSKLKPLLLNRVSQWVALSGELAGELQALSVPTDRIELIANGVNSEVFKPASAVQKKQLRYRYQLPEDAVLFLFIGRFVRRKGLLDLLDAWQNINSAENNHHLILVGSGKDQSDSIEKDVVARIAAMSNVTHVGLTQNPVAYYQMADIHVFPSHREGLPNALLEGMSSQLAPIVTNIGGVRDVVTAEHDCLMVEPHNPEALQQAIETLLTDTERRQLLATRARETVLQRYSIERAVQQYSELYESLVA